MSDTASFSTVLLPGLACDARLWRDQLAALAPRYAPRVADVHTRADTLPAMARRLLAEQPGELVLIGASMRGVALLGSTARADSDELRALRGQAIAEFEAGRGDDVLEANVWFVFHRSAWDDEPLLNRYRAMLSRAGSTQLIAQNRALMAAADLRPALPGLACPTLVVCGEGDAITPPECSREMAAAIPGARLEWLPECGHMLTMEKPAAVNALLLAWLGSLEHISAPGSSG